MSSIEFPNVPAPEPSSRQARQLKYFATGILGLAGLALLWPFLGRNLRDLVFLPHEFCYRGNTTLITTHLASDLLIGISYVVISLTLLYLVRASQGGIPFHWMFLAFGTFIIACGATHFMEALTLWRPDYWAAAYVKVVTAIASVATAVALPLSIPRIIGNIQSVKLAEARRTQLLAANEQLSAANEKLHDLDRLRRRFIAQAAANIGNWEWDLRNGKVTWDEEVEAMHGLDPGTFDGSLQSWRRTVHPDDMERTNAAVEAAIHQHSDYDIEYRSVRPDGSTFWMAARGAVECDDNGTPLRMLGMCMDISRRKETEDALRKSEKLAATGRLAATIAHEINNPLEAVTNLIFLARKEMSDAERDDLLHIADRELQRVGHITRQTLGFYRDSGRVVDVDVAEVLRNVLHIFEGKLKSKQVRVRLDAGGEAWVKGAPGELAQVFANLISNALDASTPGSQVRVRTRAVNGTVRVAIADQGCGITPDVRRQVFEPFFTTKKDVGTGLGLWISRRIVEHHGGSIRFRSSADSRLHGTVFVVDLQAAPPVAAAATTA